MHPPRTQLPDTAEDRPPEDDAQLEPQTSAGDEEQVVADDLLVEDVSIDGMCGVY